MLVIRRRPDGQFIFEERRPPQQNLLTLIIIALIFLSFQANLHNHMANRQMHVNTGFHEKNKYGGRATLHPKFHHKLEEVEIPIKVNGTLLVGVRKDDRKLYLPNDEGLFTCLDGKQKVLFDKVNDNACDCSDGSDEPGTSACNFHFYCEPEHRYLKSNLVNDGVCDCCDGSDEWRGFVLSEENKLPKEGPNVHFSPCFDRCYDYDLKKEAEEDSVHQGEELKLQYIKEAANLPDEERSLFGANGEYYRLSKVCFKYRSPSYVYELCPFQKATQDDGMNENPVSLGKNGLLNFEDPEKPKLLMPNGLGSGCPNNRGRQTEVHFKCGVADEITYVQEPSTCIYRFDFTTPAACKTTETNNFL